MPAADEEGSGGSAVVGDCGIVIARVRPQALTGDVPRSTMRADRQRIRAILADRAVVARDPQPGTSRSVVGDRGVVVATARPGVPTGDVHRPPARANRQSRGEDVAVAGAVVPGNPQTGAGG